MFMFKCCCLQTEGGTDRQHGIVLWRQLRRYATRHAQHLPSVAGCSKKKLCRPVEYTLLMAMIQAIKQLLKHTSAVRFLQATSYGVRVPSRLGCMGRALLQCNFTDCFCLQPCSVWAISFGYDLECLRSLALQLQSCQTALLQEPAP